MLSIRNRSNCIRSGLKTVFAVAFFVCYLFSYSQVIVNEIAFKGVTLECYSVKRTISYDFSVIFYSCPFFVRYSCHKAKQQGESG